jgi:hypothetical protein
MQFKIFLGKSEGEKPLRRPGYRLDDNIKMVLRDVGFQDLD